MMSNTFGRRSESSSPISSSIYRRISPTTNMATNQRTRTPSPISRYSPSAQPPPPPTPPSSSSSLSTTIKPSCNFRYVGCYLLIIISDGCDQLRQQSWLRQQKSSNNLQPQQQQQSELDKFNSRWTSGFVAKVIQQIRKG